MQPGTCAIALVLLLFAPAAQAARQAVRSGEAAAKIWLKEHRAPQGDELAELKAANPEAYAIVKALLTKRSLGLLNPKHPSASFAAPAAAQAEEALASSGSSLTADAVYPEAASPPAQHDWLHWKPKQSAIDDEAMVSNVLGAVAELKSGRPHTKSLIGKSQGTDDAPPPTEPPAEASPQEPAIEENSDPKVLDLGTSAAPGSPEAGATETSHLNNADMGSSMPKPNLRQDSNTQQDYLASFSWDDEPSKPHQVPVSMSTPKQSPQHKDALQAWLVGGPQESSTPTHTAAISPPQATAPDQARNNPYMDYLR